MTNTIIMDELIQAALIRQVEDARAELTLCAADDAEYRADARSRVNASVKALSHWLDGVRPTPVYANRYIVPSATQAGVRYYTTPDDCSCPATRHCWHRQLVGGYEMAEECADLQIGAIE